MKTTGRNEWDVFISHASEDKDVLVRPLARALGELGLRVWFDEFTIRVGDSLRRSIDRGLANARYGVVVLSPSFFAKEWPQVELDGLAARERGGQKVILPVWHDIDRDGVLNYSPTLADRAAARSIHGLDRLIRELTDAMEIWPARSSPSAQESLSAAQRAADVERVAVPAVSEAERLVASMTCPKCKTFNPIKCASCGKCFICFDEKPRWWRKIWFSDGYNCSSCSEDNMTYNAPS